MGDHKCMFPFRISKLIPELSLLPFLSGALGLLGTYSRTSVARTPLGPRKYVRDWGISS